MKKEFLEGKRTFIFWVTATIILIGLLVLMILKGQTPDISFLWWWSASSSVFLGKNYLESKDTKKFVSIIKANQGV